MASSRKASKGRRALRKPSQVRDVDLQELLSIVEQAKSVLSDEQHGKLKAAVDTLGVLTLELEAKDVSVQRLRQLIFGPSSEKSSAVLSTPSEGESSPLETGVASSASAEEGAEKAKRKGHGRNAAASYKAATKVSVKHETLTPGDPCPECPTGKVYRLKKPSVLVRVTGMAPLGATVVELERLRCNLCSFIFSAKRPPEYGPKKYDESSASMVALLKYGAGLPFYRIEKLQKNLGIPLPASTQWELVAKASEQLVPAYQELVRHAAQGEVIHNDDTTMKILELIGKRREKAIAAGDIDPDQRVGIFTSGILSKNKDVEIALFFTGTKHAGENLAEVLAHRAEDLSAPIQMCDALSRNFCGEFDTILSHCLVHSRRQFVEVAENFPQACRFVIETLREVYKVDAESSESQLSDDERLKNHQQQSGPKMAALRVWLDEQFKNKLVEPNSTLGDAIKYMQKHWEKLTVFLRVPGAPLDNNVCERILKKSILHRKNAYFYRTRRGARIGDLYMSLIHSAELGRVNTFEYLVALQRNAEAVAKAPGNWMPWNFQDTLEADKATAPNKK